MLVHLFISLPFVVCTVWFVSLLLDYISEPTDIRRRLIVFMFTAAFLYVGHMAYFSHETDNYIYADAMYAACNLAVYPLYLIYIIQLTEGKIRSLTYLILLPAAIAGVLYVVYYTMMSSEEISNFVQTYLYKGTTTGLDGKALLMARVHQAAKFIFCIMVVITLVKGFTLLHRFSQRIRSYYADTEGRTLKPVKTLLILFVVTSVLSFIANILGREQFYENKVLIAIPSVLFSSLLFGIGYIGSRQMFSHIDFEQDYASEAEDALQTSEELEMLSKMEELARRIEWLMQEERFYLQPNLKVSDLARRLGTNSKYISQAINQVLGEPFADYINNYRIRYAKELHQQHPDLPISEVAHRSGYLSMQSFYRNLKSREGK